MIKETLVARYITTICITFLLVFTAEAATLDDAKLAIRTQDFATAAKILKPLARKGDKQAQYQMAVLYRNGQGIKENPKNSAYWMDKSARQGYERAQYLLGTYYEDGIGVKSDRKNAIYWYSAAVKQGHKNAGKRLKKIQSGESVSLLIDNAQNPEEALVDAVSTGNIKAAKQLLEDGVSAETRCKYQRPVILYAA
ncbi:MAG: hypothetical protein GQ549_01105, partial [Gammaproteobacteria bacterium]|nr:hypothetical protein [Gammaproteobacteria bacterium]